MFKRLIEKVKTVFFIMSVVLAISTAAFFALLAFLASVGFRWTL